MALSAVTTILNSKGLQTLNANMPLEMLYIFLERAYCSFPDENALLETV
jgi:hypothetical protein